MRGSSIIGLMAMPLTCLVLGIGFIMVLSRIYGVRGSRLMVVEAFVLSYLLRVGLIFFNENYLIFEHKYAGELSLDLYQKYLLGIGGFRNISQNLLELAKEQFALQTLINAPFFAFFGESLMTILYTNSLFGAISGSVASVMLYQPCGEKVARRALILFSLYPACVNFSIFGLRDPLIYFFMMVFAIGALACHLGYSRRFHFVVSFIGCSCMLSLRPELAYVVVALVGLLVLPSVLAWISPDQRPVERLAVAGVFLLVLAAIGTGMAAVSLKVAAAQIGASSSNPLVIADENATERASRHEEGAFGGGSHLVSIDSYENLPVYYRIPVQTVGLIVLPFPWMISGIAHALTFMDSIFLMVLMWLSLMHARKGARFSYASFAMLLAYCVAILGMGFIVSNAGNGFRMRFGVVPLCLLAGSFCRLIPNVRLRRD